MSLPHVMEALNHNTLADSVTNGFPHFNAVFLERIKEAAVCVLRLWRLMQKLQFAQRLYL